MVEQLKTAASTYIVKYTRHMFIEQPNNNDLFRQCLNSILMMLELDISFQLKRRFATALHVIVEKMGRQTRQELTKYLLQSIIQCRSMDGINIFKYQQLSQVAYTVIISSREDSRMGESILEINLAFLNFIKRVQHQLKIHLAEPDSPATLRLIHLLKALLQIIKTTFKNIKFERMPQVIKIVFSDELENALMTAFKMKLPLDVQNNIIIFNDSVVANQLNSIKSSCVVIMTLGLRILFKNVLQPSLLTMSSLYSKGKIYLDMFIESVAGLLRVTTISNVKSQEIKELVSEILTNVNMLLTNPLYLGYFEQIHLHLFQEIISPLLVSTEEDIDRYMEEPVQFMQSVIFTWKSWRSAEEDEASRDQTIKSSAAHMLSNICRYQDGFVKKFVYETLEKIKISSGFQRILCLQMISIIQPNTADRQQLVTEVQKCIQRQMTAFQTRTFKNRVQLLELFYMLFMLYAYTPTIANYDGVFETTFSIQIALGLLTGSLFRGNQACQMICLYILKAIGQTNSLAIYQIAGEIVRFLCTKIGSASYIQLVLDYLSQMLQKNAQIIARDPQNLTICVSLLIKRIQKMLDVPDSKPIINRCWNCIREIVSNRCYDKLTKEIQPIVCTLYGYISKPSVDFDEDILIVAMEFIRKSKGITDQHARLFQEFPKVFEKNKHRFLNMFECINIYLLYGRELLSSSVKALEMILEMCFKAMFAVDPLSINEADNCQGVLIIQNLIFSLGQHFPDVFWGSIMENCQKRLKWRFISNVFFSGNLVATIAMCLQACMRVQSSKSQHYLSLVLTSLTYIMDEHPCKVYAAYLSQVLLKYEIPLIGSNFVHILDCVSTLLRLNYSRSNSEMDEMEIQLDDKSQDQKDYIISMGVFHCELKNIDAYGIFKNAVLAVKQNEPHKMEKVLAQLIPEKKQYLKTLMGLRRTEDGEYRAILKVKRS